MGSKGFALKSKKIVPELFTIDWWTVVDITVTSISKSK